MNIIADSLAALSIAGPVVQDNLVAWPLVRPESPAPDYLVLDEALATGAARVTEVSEGGHVPELSFENAAPKPVLLVDGEELVGARQNRVLNVTLLVAAGASLVIPVSCVEQGRWAWRSRHFESSRRSMYARGRARKTAQVSRNLRVANSRHADQAAIWEDVRAKAEAFAVQSDTHAMADVYESARVRLDRMTRRFVPRRDQVGAVFAVAGRIAGLELFDCAATWEKLGAKLTESYAFDALEGRSSDTEVPAPRQVADFLIRVQQAQPECFDALAMGEDIRVDGAGVVGAGLRLEDRLIQLSVFEDPEEGTPGRHRGRARIVSLAQRRAARGRH